MLTDTNLDELQSDEGYGFGPASGDEGLGDQGACQEGANPALGDLQESICIWRHGDLVLIVGGPIAQGVLRPYADAMDAAAAN